MRARALATVIAATLALLLGCKAKTQRTDPAAVARAFVEAMVAGHTSEAAGLWDYVTEARQSNSDWDDIPPGQRKQIIGKLQAEKAENLKAQTGLFAAGSKAGAPSVSGQTASVPVEGGSQGALVLTLSQSDGQWGVTGFGPAPGG
jgi:hypothetical protein